MSSSQVWHDSILPSFSPLLLTLSPLSYWPGMVLSSMACFDKNCLAAVSNPSQIEAALTWIANHPEFYGEPQCESVNNTHLFIWISFTFARARACAAGSHNFAKPCRNIRRMQACHPLPLQGDCHLSRSTGEQRKCPNLPLKASSDR